MIFRETVLSGKTELLVRIPGLKSTCSNHGKVGEFVVIIEGITHKPENFLQISGAKFEYSDSEKGMIFGHQMGLICLVFTNILPIHHLICHFTTIFGWTKKEHIILLQRFSIEKND